MEGKKRTAFFYIAGGGFVVSFVVHILSVFKINAELFIPSPFVLHVAALIVFAAAVFHLKRNFENSESSPFNLKPTLSPASFIPGIKKRPDWLRALLAISFIYTFINMVWFFMNGPAGQATIENGTYVLKEKGRFIKQLSRQEYMESMSAVYRFFSGHWMFFFLVSVTILYPSNTENKLANQVES